MRDRQNDRVGRLQCVQFSQRHAVFVPGVRSIRQGIVHLHRKAERFQFADDIDDARIARIRNVLLEGQAEDGDDPSCPFRRSSPRTHSRAMR